MFKSDYAFRKCEHCGQWGGVMLPCGTCGAPIDPVEYQQSYTSFGSNVGYPRQNTGGLEMVTSSAANALIWSAYGKDT